MMHSQKDFLNNYMSILKKLKKDSWHGFIR
jgi:hypothetical protein